VFTPCSAISTGAAEPAAEPATGAAEPSEDHKIIITENDSGQKEAALGGQQPTQLPEEKATSRMSRDSTVNMVGGHDYLTQSPDTDTEASIPRLSEDPIGACRGVCKHIVTSKAFDPIMGIVILMNAACMGISIDWELQGKDRTILSALEHVFLAVFIIELLLNVVAHGPECLRGGWHFFDFVVIVGGVMSLWVLEPTMPGSNITKCAQQILILRMMRLLKLARAVRFLSSFRPLWKLTQSFMQCAPTMASAFLMMLLTIYIFACVGVEFIAKGEWIGEEVTDLVRTRFSSIPLTMLSLVQFVTGDSISGLYYPLIVQKPALCVYFMALLMMVTPAAWSHFQRSALGARLRVRT
jgi:voltage-gated sodium channel